MKIKGLQKLTLLDYPEKMAATVFTGGCNFCCPFCHNAELVTGAQDNYEISQNDLFQFLEKRKKVLDGVCVTGGEPLIHPELEEFLKRIKEKGYLVKLDTNGSYPDRLAAIVEKGLIDYVAMDIKNSKEKYAQTIGVLNFDIRPVEDSVQYLLEGPIDFEFRTTVVKEFHEKDDFASIGEWIAGDEKYFLQGFEDSGNVIRDGLHGYSKEELEDFVKLLCAKVPKTKIRGI